MSEGEFRCFGTKDPKERIWKISATVQEKHSQGKGKHTAPTFLFRKEPPPWRLCDLPLPISLVSYTFPGMMNHPETDPLVSQKESCSLGRATFYSMVGLASQLSSRRLDYLVTIFVSIPFHYTGRDVPLLRVIGSLSRNLRRPLQIRMTFPFVV